MDEPEEPSAASGESSDMILFGLEDTTMVGQRLNHSIADIPIGTEFAAKHRYRAERRLGKGGMGSVYLATRLREEPDTAADMPETVAIKFYFAAPGQTSLKLMKRELSAVLALHNECIPPVLDWCIDGQWSFVVYPFYEKGSLGDHLAKEGALDEPRLWELLRDLLTALNASHGASILHLDIKPFNVLLGDNGRYLLGDFGLAQGHRVSMEFVSIGAGSAPFRSPEQQRLRHEVFDTRTDLWGVGLTAWSAWTGLGKLQEVNPLLEKCSGSFHGLPAPSSFRAGCSSELEEVIMSLLTTRIEDRPGSAAEVLARMSDLKRTEKEFPATAALPLIDVEDPDVGHMIASLLDPLWAGICRDEMDRLKFARYRPGDLLCQLGESSYYTFVLLNGTIVVERNGAEIGRENREGTFIGEITALTGSKRTATLRALGTVWVLVFNPADLESFITENAAASLRLIKSLAKRFLDETNRARS